MITYDKKIMEYYVSIVLCLAFFILLIVGSFQFGTAGELPRLMSSLGVLCIILTLFYDLVRKELKYDEEITTKREFVALTVLVYLFVVQYIGFRLSTIVYSYLTMYIITRNQGLKLNQFIAVIYSLVLSFGVYYIFVNIFGVRLPEIF